jgi:hypothetical protein
MAVRISSSYSILRQMLPAIEFGVFVVMLVSFPYIIMKLFYAPENTIRLVVCTAAQTGKQDMTKEFLEMLLRRP